MLLGVFNGGLSTRRAKNLIDISEGTIVKDVEIFSNILTPLNSPGVSKFNLANAKSGAFVVFKDSVVEGEPGTEFLEYQEVLYRAQPNRVIEKTKDGDIFYELGLNKPKEKIRLVNTTVTFTFSTAANSNGIRPGTYNYRFGYETTLGKKLFTDRTYYLNNTATVVINGDMLKMRHFNVYRQWADGKYRFVGSADVFGKFEDKEFNIESKAEFNPLDYPGLRDNRTYTYTYYSTLSGFESASAPISDIANIESNAVDIEGIVASTEQTVDKVRVYRMGGLLTDFFMVKEMDNNAVVPFTDYLSDVEALEGELLETAASVKPPSNLTNIVEYNSTLFGSVGSTLWFSSPGLLDIWVSNSWIEFAETITGLGVTQNGLLVFSKNKTWVLMGDNPNNYTKFILSTNQGCIDNRSIQFINNTLLWLSYDGICVSNGGAIDNISINKLGMIKYSPISSAIFEQQYFLFHKTGVLVIDFREGIRFYESSVKALAAYYHSNSDEMLLNLDNESKTIYSWAKGPPLSLHYKTGILPDKGVTVYKTYKDFYMFVNGELTVSIYIDGELVLENFKLTNGLNTVRTPQSKTKGYTLELEYKGKGNLVEVEFESLTRQNGN